MDRFILISVLCIFNIIVIKLIEFIFNKERRNQEFDPSRDHRYWYK